MAALLVDGWVAWTDFSLVNWKDFVVVGETVGSSEDVVVVNLAALMVQLWVD